MNPLAGEPEPITTRLRDDATVARLIVAKGDDPYGAAVWWAVAGTADACLDVTGHEPADAPVPTVRRALLAALDLAGTAPGPLPPQRHIAETAAPPLLYDAAGRLAAALRDSGSTGPGVLTGAACDVLDALTPYVQVAAARVRAARPDPCPRPYLRSRAVRR